ncbi:MAG: hypothetical protein ACK53V_24115, partial [Planctomycetota bacterium]
PLRFGFAWGLCLPEEIQAGTGYNFERWPGLRDDGGWLGLRGGSFRPTPHPRNNTLHRSRRAARLFDRQLTRGGPVNASDMRKNP